MASTQGKIELDTVGDVREEKVVEKLVRQSINQVFREYFDVTEFDQLVAGFEKGLNVQVVGHAAFDGVRQPARARRRTQAGGGRS